MESELQELQNCAIENGKNIEIKYDAVLQRWHLVFDDYETDGINLNDVILKAWNHYILHYQ